MHGRVKRATKMHNPRHKDTARMPSPFPGMDPYMEHHALWPGVHQGLITFMWSALNTLLPPRYVASIVERYRDSHALVLASALREGQVVYVA